MKLSLPLLLDLLCFCCCCCCCCGCCCSSLLPRDCAKEALRLFWRVKSPARRFSKSEIDIFSRFKLTGGFPPLFSSILLAPPPPPPPPPQPPPRPPRGSSSISDLCCCEDKSVLLPLCLALALLLLLLLLMLLTLLLLLPPLTLRVSFNSASKAATLLPRRPEGIDGLLAPMRPGSRGEGRLLLLWEEKDESSQ